PLDRRIAELRLRLPLELRVSELHRDDRREALADVLALEVLLLLLEEPLLTRVPVEGSRERGPEAGQMRAALGRVDVVGERDHGLDVGAVPLHGDLDLAVLALAIEVDDVLMDRILRLVDVGHEIANAALVVELLGLPACPLVSKDDAQAA